MKNKNDSQPEKNAVGKKVKKTYKKPELKSERILEAGLGATCNGTANGGRKAETASACNAGSLKT